MANKLLQVVLLTALLSTTTTNAFAPSPFTTTATQQRLTTTTSLNAAPSKTREEELASLAQRLEITPTKVRELLFSQRQKLKENDPKARRIDWLLDGAKDVVEKRKRQNTATLGGGAAKRDSPPAAVVKNTKQPAATKKTPTTKTSSSTTKNNDASLLSNISFAQRTDLHPATKRALTETLGLTTMTDIQAKTYAAALSGKDVLGRARTGTGKTIAFLLPAIERLLRTPEYDEGSMIGVVVISPTRELASQIGDEADKLLSFHRDMSTQVVFGGTKTTRDVSRLKAKLPTVLVATPGRLKDLLQTASVRGKKFASIMKQTPIVVLD